MYALEPAIAGSPGEGGDDLLDGGAGADAMNGGAGIDTATYAGSTAGVVVTVNGAASGGFAQGDTLAGIENLAGSAFDDSLEGDGAANVLNGLGGADTLQGRGGADTLNGGDGIDTASYAASAAAVTVTVNGAASGGGAQGDSLIAIENLTGSAFADTLIGDAVANALSGGAGDDTLRGGAGADTLDGGAGSDFANYQGSAAAVAVNLLAGTASGGDAQGDVLTGIENLFGSGFGDQLTGNAGANALTGGAGADTLQGADTLRGDTGPDTASYATSAAAVTVTVNGAASGGDAAGDTLVSIENLTGSAFADTLTGDGGANDLTGNAGDDLLDGGAGADRLEGGAGGDTYVVDSASDVVSEAAGQGTDEVRSTVTIAALAENVENLNLLGTVDLDGTGNGLDNEVRGNDGDNVLSGLAGNDQLKGSEGADTLEGGDGDDRLNGLSYGATGDADVLRGGLGDDLYSIDSALDVVDELTGGGGTDTVYAHVSHTLAEAVENLALKGAALAGTGNGLANRIEGNAAANALDGAAGDDRLVGVGGADTLTGGEGRDRFDYDQAAHSTAAAFDTITDFVRGEDRIDLATIDADTGVDGNQAFAFIGGAAFIVAGQVRVVQEGGQTVVQADVDGDLAADLVIRLDGLPALPALTAGDFAL